jgi:ABC-type transport system involved in multi-copper enzyme maturation permease subunit
MRLLRGELLKLVKRPATRTTFLIVGLAIVLIYVGMGAVAATLPAGEDRDGLASLLTFPDAYGSLLALFPLFGGMALAIYAGLVIGSEWSWGTLRVAFTRGEPRWRYVLTTFLAIALLAFIAVVVLFGVGAIAAVAAAAISGFPTGDLGHAETLIGLPLGLVGAWLGMVIIASLAFAVSLVARSQVAGIGLVVALFFGEQFAALVLPPEVLQFAPVAAARGLLTPDGVVVPLVALAYLAVALVASSMVIERAEIA